MQDDPTLPVDDKQSRLANPPPGLAEWGGFSLLARVGHGGFGEVYRAWDSHLEREVALKLLLPGSVGGEEEYRTMLQEARALASVRHPNVVHVYGMDRHEGRVGFWTDFVHGKTLSALLGDQGPFGYREAALIGLDVAKALSAVHRVGLLHRDIKAENVMREEGGRILLMDFGLSTLRQRQNNVAGTPNYMAPELFAGEQATAASDIYAMGVLLYYLVAAEFPVRLGGLTRAEAASAISRRRPLIDLRPDLPESFLRVVSGAMEMDAAKRFASAGQLAAALAECLGASGSVDSLANSSRANEIVMRSKARRRIGLWAAGAAAVLLVAAGLGVRTEVGSRWLHQEEGAAATGVSSSTYDQFLKAQDLLQHSYKQANIAAAITGFQQVLHQDPKFALAEAGLGSAYFLQYRNSRDAKLLDMAKTATNQALAMDSTLAAPYITLARIEAMAGKTQVAMEQVQRAIRLDPHSAEAYGALAEIEKAQGRTEESFAALEKAIDLAPEDPRWPLRLGSYQFQAGDLQEAVTQFQKTIALTPDNPDAYFDLGTVDMQLNKLSEARSNLERSSQLEPDFDTYKVLGVLSALEGKFTDAISRYKQALELNPTSFETWGNLGSAYLWGELGHEKADDAYRKAIQLAEAERQKTPSDPSLLVELADYYASVGDKGRSSVLLRQSLALSNDDPSISYRAGETYELLGQREKAIQLIAKSLAQGYHANEFQRSPELAALRTDPAFQAALNNAKAENGVDSGKKLN
jgi:tetratricopeptide (TPR) repeat protein